MSADRLINFGFSYLSSFAPAGHYKFSCGFYLQLLYFYSALVPGRRFSNSATNANARTLAAIL
jgi:hypothetical protein